MKKSVLYSSIRIEEIKAYQIYFEKMLSVVDLQNETKRSKDVTFNEDQSEIDYRKVKEYANEAGKNGLNAVILQVMLEQYFYADPLLREMHKHAWVEKVMNRENEDFFPHENAVLQLFDVKD